jgi:transketolase
MRPAIRLSAIMKLPVIYVFTHDSIGLGEDGPTHQPVEQLMSLRLIPNFTVIRPADASETVEAWLNALQRRSGPTALILSRQNLPLIDRKRMAPAKNLNKGGYILNDLRGIIDIILIASGSEVSIALAAAEVLESKNKKVRVVSMPSWEIFSEQSEKYRQKVLPSEISKRISIEAGAALGWERYTGFKGRIIGINSFGSSAPGKILLEKFGFTVQKVVEVASQLLSGE